MTADAGASRPTRVLKVDPSRPEPEIIREAAAVLRRGGLVAFPTETVYGLGANGLDPEAVAGIFRAKGRPADNPLILHVAHADDAARLAASWPPVAQRAAEAFWPGPLTLVVPSRGHVPSVVTAGLPTVAVRIPDHPVALALLREAGVPVAAPSANRSGRPSPTRAEHVWHDLQGRVDLILDAGPVGIGVESTVLDVTTDPPTVLRPGGVAVETLRAVLGDVAVDPYAVHPPGDAHDEEEEEGRPAPRSPGMKYRHYAPSCPVELIVGEPAARRRTLGLRVAHYLEKGQRVGVVVTEEGAGALSGENDRLLVRIVGPAHRPDLYARRLFQYLRELEGAGSDVIIMEGIEPEGIGLAVMNRLRKAAGSRIIEG